MSEAKDVAHRWRYRKAEIPARWYTIEYDENSVAWLVADDDERLCLEHGMQLDVAQLAYHRASGKAKGRPQTTRAKQSRR